MMTPLLEITNLNVSFHLQGKTIYAVRGVSFFVNKGETVALVGESGCGKSVTAQSILKLIPSASCSGSILFNKNDLIVASEKKMEEIRGRDIGMVFQDPMSSLNPTMKIGAQMIEGLIRHRKICKKEALNRAVEMLSLVGINQPETRINQYPFEFSGGMRQRVVIAMALICEPQLLIADEPTTALDVTVQAQILKLLKELKQTQNTSLLVITHDLGIVAGICDRVVVMYAGKIAEVGTVDQIFYQPQHPYTQALLKAIPKLGKDKKTPLLPIMGSPPDLAHPPMGCPFHPRCAHVMKVCENYQPPLFTPYPNQKASCWLHHPFANGGVP